MKENGENVLQNLQNYRSEGSFPNKGKNKSKVFFKKNNLVCFIKFPQKPHGDLKIIIWIYLPEIYMNCLLSKLI